MGEDVARYYWEHISVFRLDEEYNEHWDYFLGQLLKYIVVRLHTALAEF